MLAVAYKFTDLDPDILTLSQDKKVIAKTPITSPSLLPDNFKAVALKKKLTFVFFAKYTFSISN